MATKIYIIICLLGTLGIGFVYMVRRMNALYTRVNFIHEFRNKFIDLGNLGSVGSKYYDHSRVDYNLHHWLTLNAVKAQREIGGFGIGVFMAPFQLYKINHYEFITQTVGKFTEGLLHTQEIAIVDNILTRWLGAQNDAIEEIEKDIKNPLKWFQYGVRLILSLPIRILNWFGIISESNLD